MWLLLILLPILLLVGIVIAISSIKENHDRILELEELVSEVPYPKEELLLPIGEDKGQQAVDTDNKTEEAKDGEEESPSTATVEDQIEEGLLPAPEASDVESRRKMFLTVQTKKALDNAANNLENVKKEVLKEQEQVEQDKKSLDAEKQVSALNHQITQSKDALKQQQLKNQSTLADISRERLKTAQAQYDKAESLKAQDKLEDDNERLVNRNVRLLNLNDSVEEELEQSKERNKQLATMLEQERAKQEQAKQQQAEQKNPTKSNKK